MKASQLLIRAGAVVSAFTAGAMLMLTPSAAAIQYTPDHTGLTSPGFNVFTGVPDEGNEADFLRGKESTNTGDSVNNVQSACNNNTKYTLRVYVHNGANQTLNANGSGIARGTKVKVALPGAAEASNFNLNGTISATNAATVNDNMTITCAGGKKVKLSYVAGSAKQYTSYTGTTALSDTIVTTGAPIGTNQPDGNVLGCFGQRVYVTLDVKVEEVQKPEPKPSTGVCKLLDVVITNNKENEILATVTGEVDNATVVGYKIDFGDGTIVNTQSATHRYAKKNAQYTITSMVQIKLADGTTVWREAQNCKRYVKVTVDENPKTPPIEITVPPTIPGTVKPATLPATGPADVAAVAAVISMIGSVGYYIVSRRLGLN